MSRTITIRVSDEIYQELKARAAVENTTVTALITEAAMRDPRLSAPSDAARRFREEARDLFRDAFGTDGPKRDTGQAAA